MPEGFSGKLWAASRLGLLLQRTAWPGSAAALTASPWVETFAVGDGSTMLLTGSLLMLWGSTPGWVVAPSECLPGMGTLAVLKVVVRLKAFVAESATGVSAPGASFSGLDGSYSFSNISSEKCGGL